MNGDVAALPDGEYEIVVVDAENDDRGVARLSVVIVAGELKGMVASIKGPPGSRETVSLMGLPGTLTVHEGEPSLRLE